MTVSVKSQIIKLTTISAIVLASLTLSPLANAAFPFSTLKQEVPSLAPMLEEVTPAVVTIAVEGNKEVKASMDPFQYFFGNRRGAPQTQERPFKGMGSGVIIDKDKGYVVTNYHVINDADEIIVKLKDGREFVAKKLGGDKDSDIAVLKIDPDNLAEITIANSDKAKVGDFVVAIGNPFGLGQTVTSGIISAKGRSGLMGPNQGLEDFIQTDAAINSGNSGGALVNLKGELVGINTAIIAPSGGNVGIGFAIPSVMMNNLMEQIIEFGEVKRGVLGISGSNFDAEMAKSFGVDVAQGAFVAEVVADSSADKGGLKMGDIITHVDGNKIKSFDELRSKVASKGAGKKVELTAIRDGDEVNLTVTLGSADKPAITAENIHPSLKGAKLANGKTQRGEDGIEVTELNERSPAAMLGLEKGDVIVAVNRTRLTSVAALRDMLSEAKGVLALNVVRGNSSLYILIR
ncbi:DegQ family serine endoprotease [Psychrosphaera aquimarina]|uniref:DegQ family serine endoprotease n=1 Tax=Psychrosphaera aquimarina TaxID=2044854 RepID=A0ABU3R2R7_9GAMM|nr:DegQ family serine endoprotease [Psychrosphaera aquimarina]MDU0113974.1 DegQ family serine endoprotease [Psychrosphaera aquimarina]